MSARKHPLQRGCKQCAKCTHGEATSCDAKRAAYRQKDQRRGALRHGREPWLCRSARRLAPARTAHDFRTAA